MGLTVVLLDYNGGQVLERCVRSLCAQSKLPQKIIFVDNGSERFEKEKVAAMFGERLAGMLEFVRIEKNIGYARGMNRGLESVTANATATEWVMTLSNDTELTKDFFESFERVSASVSDQVGMLAPKLRAMHNQDMLDGTGIGVCLDGMSTARGQRELDRSQYDTKTHILIPNGVSAIYRVKMLQDVGLMDESFWAYCEDTDLGLRGWLAGWECRFVPECVVYHARSATLGEHSLNKLYYAERNHYWVAVKNLPLVLVLLNPIFSMYRYFVQAYALLSGQGQGKGYGQAHSATALALATARDILDAIKGIPYAFVQRYRLRKLKRRPYLEVLRTLWEKRMRFDELILK